MDNFVAFIRWDSIQYNTAVRVADVPGAGRYCVKRRKTRARDWSVFLNGDCIATAFPSRDAAMNHVNNLHHAKGLTS
jgi:hypothetical protein